MPVVKKVVLNAINSELRLKNNGVTIRVVDPNDSNKSGRLTIGKATIWWTPSIKGAKIRGRLSKSKRWEELIDFFMRSHS